MFHMETNRLRYFCTIAEIGSLTKASDILGVSHSGLSKAISVLEDETKLKLFKPLGRGLEITPEGTWFYQKAQEILKIENEISIGLKRDRLPICIGLSEVIAITCASLVIKELAGPCSIVETDVGEIEGKILSGEIDFGFIFSPSPRKDLEYLELGEVKINSYARVDFLKDRKPEQLYFTVPTTNFPFNPLGYKIRDGWPQNILRVSHFSASSFAISLNLARASKTAIYMPNFVADLENELQNGFSKFVKVPYHKDAESRRKLYLVKSKILDESTEMKKISKVLRRICC